MTNYNFSLKAEEEMGVDEPLHEPGSMESMSHVHQ